jgi:hypothetical protein
MSGASEATVLYCVEIMSMGGGQNSIASQEEKVATTHPLTVSQILRYGGDALTRTTDPIGKSDQRSYVIINW